MTPEELKTTLEKEEAKKAQTFKVGDEAYKLITQAAKLLHSSVAVLEAVNDRSGKSATVLVIGPQKAIKRVMKYIQANKE